MSHFPLHTIADAPAGSRPPLKALESAFGFLPNIARAMATSPVLIGSLVEIFGKVHGGSFTEPQIQVLLLTNAVTNGAEWAVACHSALARREGVEAADVEAIRSRELPRDGKLAALSRLARTLIEKRGTLGTADRDDFLEAGFTPEHLLEVVTVSAASTITNYTANLAQPPLEAPFAEHRWRAA